MNYSEDYKRIESAINFIRERHKERPSVDEVASHTNTSRYHFQRLFKKWAGITPLQFMNSLTLEYSKQKLTESADILNTAYDAGLSGSGRLHDLFVNFEGMSPGEFKSAGEGVTISYGFSETPFGEALIASTTRGICYMGFIEDSRKSLFEDMQRRYPSSEYAENGDLASGLIDRIFDEKSKKPFNISVKGTNFQINVWRALLKIPEGKFVHYQDVANYLGMPKGYRAVASAIASNPVGYLIPCHRVLAKSGAFSGYRWGVTRKQALFVRESHI